jgi:hypothetical protein
MTTVGELYFGLFNPFKYVPLPLYLPLFSVHILMSSTFTSLWYAILLMLYHSLFLSLFPWVPQSSSTVTNMFYIWVCMWSCLFLSMCLSLDLLPHMRKNIRLLCFWSWLTSVNIMSVLQLHPFTFKPHVIIPCGWVILHCEYIPQFIDSLISCRASGLFPELGYYE